MIDAEAGEWPIVIPSKIVFKGQHFQAQLKFFFVKSRNLSLHFFIQKAFAARGNTQSLSNGLKDKFFNQYFSPEDQELLKPLWGFVFQEIEQELGRMDLSKPLDIRFISCLHVSKEKPKKIKHRK